MSSLTPPSYLRKRTALLARLCQREPPAKAGRVMRPYAAEGWQGAALKSLTAPCALWNAAEKLLLLCAACSCCGREQSLKYRHSGLYDM